MVRCSTGNLSQRSLLLCLTKAEEDAVNHSALSMQTTIREEQRGERDTRLHGRRLTLARVVWAGLATFELGMFVVSLPGFVAQLQIVCTSSSCMNQQLSADAVRTLQHAGLSLG